MFASMTKRKRTSEPGRKYGVRLAGEEGSVHGTYG